MKILALDASTRSTGYAIFDNNKLIKYGCETAESDILIARIKIMQYKIRKIIEQNEDIQKIVLEEVRPEDISQNIKTHKALMYLQASLNFLIYDCFPKIEIEYIYPSEWRAQCGIKTGRGITRVTLKKKDIEFVRENWGTEVNDDTADAIGIGYGYLREREKNGEMVSFK